MLFCVHWMSAVYTLINHMKKLSKPYRMHCPYIGAPQKWQHSSFLIDFLRIVLRNYWFNFNGRHFHQIAGTAMGTKLASSCAHLFMSHFEDKCVYIYLLHSFLWKRYIDDIFPICTYSLGELVVFINHLNRCHPTIKSTQEVSLSEVPFLDLHIYKTATRLHTRLYVKLTNRHRYLRYKSEHPKSFRDSIPYSQFL